MKEEKMKCKWLRTIIMLALGATANVFRQMDGNRSSRTVKHIR